MPLFLKKSGLPYFEIWDHPYHASARFGAERASGNFGFGVGMRVQIQLRNLDKGPIIQRGAASDPHSENVTVSGI